MIHRVSLIVATVTLVALAVFGKSFPATTVAPDRSRRDQFIQRSDRHLIDDIAPLGEGGVVRVVVEIPAGTNEKWEVDKEDGHLKWEFKDGKPRIVRFLPYPANYGMVPRTLVSDELGGDGDPLDVLVLGPAVSRGSLFGVRLVGVLKLLDDGQQDDKLLAVIPGTPFEDVDDLTELKSEFPGLLPIIELWFTSYKGRGKIEFLGFDDAAAAKQILAVALQAYRES